MKTSVKTGSDGLSEFLRAYFVAPPDAYVTVYLASPVDQPDTEMLVLMIEHPTVGPVGLGLTLLEAKAVANKLETTIHSFPGDPEEAGIPDLILNIREAIDELKKRRRSVNPQANKES
jgi:hypothetical protein